MFPGRDRVIEEIAKRELGFPTLESRNRDALDFRDCGVGCIKEALRQAFEAGVVAGRSLGQQKG